MVFCQLRLAVWLSLAVAICTAVAATAADDVNDGKAPTSQTQLAAATKSTGCLDCHAKTDSLTMHNNPAVVLGCTDCHGGDARVRLPGETSQGSEAAHEVMAQAHVQPRFPEAWRKSGSANPRQSYALLNREDPAFVRFINPSDLRAADAACGACHQETVNAAKRSLMATGAMLFGAASYANGILPFKKYVLGEGYTDEGEAKVIHAPATDDPEAEWLETGKLSQLLPLPRWETVPPGDIFRVFEAGGRNKSNLYPETGLPNISGDLQQLEAPGKPDLRLSNRGPGTGARISFPVLNIHKTRLNDPLMWFLGTNDNPGDYRTSGCGACHVVYANDRDPRHSGPYSQFGHTGQSQTVDPTISLTDEGHPLEHRFTRAIPTSQCMSCHMHQPNMFLNTYLGYTMWDYESDAPAMFPREQHYPDAAAIRQANLANPEGAAPRGLWSDQEFLREVSALNPSLTATQFADYHGHGWNFRAVFKKDRKGNLLDADGNVVPADDPDKFTKAVHMSSVHLDAGMHCVDCHFSQDSHGDGHIYGEVANAVEIDCIDCHGSARDYPSLKTSGPAAPAGGTDLTLLRNPDGQLRFEWRGGELIQRSLLWPDREWSISLVKDTVDRNSLAYNEKAARAKLMSADSATQQWGDPNAELAHKDDNMECYSCHTSWTTSCGGCHLPGEANWKTESNHFKGGTSRNYTTYNPQVVRDQIFMLGRRGKINGGRIAPLRSTSALVLSATNANREIIYAQQPPIASSGHSSQAINPHFSHTVRKTETRVCSDCHLSRDNDNNAIFTQTLGLGTNFINFIGYHVYGGTSNSVAAIQVTEWSEPQAVIGSYLQRYAYPDYHKQHVERGRQLQTGHRHGSGAVNCLQLRGEYLYAAAGAKGLQVYDVASIANKSVSQRIVRASHSAMGQQLNIASKNATCLSLLTSQPVAPSRNEGSLMREVNQETPMPAMYRYLYLLDAEEGLILTDIATLSDADPRNNFLERALTWNEGNVLSGAVNFTIGGRYAYILTAFGLVTLDLDNPLEPVVISRLPLNRAVGIFQQFRYLYVTDGDGLKVIDVTDPAHPKVTPGNTIKIADAHKLFVARTYAYVAAGAEGLIIVDVTTPTAINRLTTVSGDITDAHDVVVATTNASLFAYVADGSAGLKVLQLTSPESQPGFYGFSPEPHPELIASYQTRSPMIALSRGLERDRAVDESGGQVAVFSRVSSGPLSEDDMRKLYLDKAGNPWFVEDTLAPAQEGEITEGDASVAGGTRVEGQISRETALDARP